MRVLTREMESQAIIHSFIFTPLKMAIGGILVPYALCSTKKLPWYLSHQSLAYIHTYSLLVRLYGTNKVRVIEVLETSWFVFCMQTCDHFHHVIKVTTEFCSSSKFSKWLPFVCCLRLHTLLFPECKPPILIHQLAFIIESLRVSVY